MNKAKQDCKVNIAITISDSSIGWCLINYDTNTIIDRGVRLFEKNNSNNFLHRQLWSKKRKDRRQNQRYITRNHDFVKLLIDYKLINNIEIDLKNKFVYKFIDQYIDNGTIKKLLTNQYGNLYNFILRKKGLNNSLTLNEIIIVLFWYIHHRGNHYTYAFKNNNEDTITIKEKEKYQKYITLINNKDYFIVDAQLEFIKNEGYLHGKFNNEFFNLDYKKELETILANQNNLLSKSFIEKYLVIFNRHRTSLEGPGNNKTLTPYSRFCEFKKINNKNILVKKQIPYSEMWQKTALKCIFHNNLFCTFKSTLSNQLFELLKELNNIKNYAINLSLNTYQKVEIIKLLLNETPTKIIFVKIAEFLELDKNNLDAIIGCYKDHNNEPIIIELSSFNIIKKALNEQRKLSINNFLNISNNKYKIIENNIFDQIISVLAKTNIVEERIKSIEELNNSKTINITLNATEIINLASIKENFSSMSSFCLKDTQELIFSLLNEPITFNKLLNNQNLINFDLNNIKEHKYLCTDWIDQKNINPAIKRSFCEAIKLINSIFGYIVKFNNKITNKVNYVLQDIVVSFNYDFNETKSKHKFDKIKQNIINTYDLNDKNTNNVLILKLWLWHQQKGKDAYDGKTINIDLNNIDKSLQDYDIDYIIPWCYCYENSISNKVLTSKENHINKGDIFLFKYLNEINFTKMKDLWYQWYIEAKETKDNEIYYDFDKYNFLTNINDYSINKNQLGFLSKNLIDNQYVCQIFINYLLEFKKVHNYFFNVASINNKAINYIKKNMFNNLQKQLNNKNNNLNGCISENAYIIYLLNKYCNNSLYSDILLNNTVIKYFALFPNQIKNNYYLSDINLFKLAITTNELQKIINFGFNELNRTLQDIKYSYSINQKLNIPFFEDRLYASKILNNNQIQKIIYFNLINITNDIARQIFDPINGNVKNTLMYYSEPKCFNELQKIYNSQKNNNDSTQPFKNYILNNNIEFVKVTFKNKKQQYVERTIKRIGVLQEIKQRLEIIQVKQKHKHA